MRGDDIRATSPVSMSASTTTTPRTRPRPAPVPDIYGKLKAAGLIEVRTIEQYYDQ